MITLSHLPLPSLPVSSNHHSIFPSMKFTSSYLHMNEIMWHLNFNAWLILLNIMIPFSSMLLHTLGLHHFLWLSKIPRCVCTTSSLPIHHLTDTEVISVSWLLWLVKQSEVKVRVNLSLGQINFISFGFISNHKVAGSYGNFIFNV